MARPALCFLTFFSALLAGTVESPNFEGFLDRAGCDTVIGWAVDRNRPGSPVLVDILVDGVYATTAATGASRDDVAAYLGSTFRPAGFAVSIPALRAGGSHVVSARFREGGQALYPPVRESPPCVAQGRVESVSCTEVRGWVYPGDAPAMAVAVAVDGLEFVAFGGAGEPRPDLTFLPAGRRDVGFRFALPSGYQDGQRHSVRVTTFGNPTLDETIVTPVCPRIWEGHVDSASCDALGGMQASGWVADRSKPNTPVSVQWELRQAGGAVSGPELASLPRPDVGAHLGDDGRHGFRLRFGISASELRLFYPNSSNPLFSSVTMARCPSSGTHVAAITGSCQTLSGWAADRNRPNVPLRIRVFVDSKEIATVVADQPRPDLQGFLRDNGNHGLTYTVPWQGLGEHVFGLIDADTGTPLPGSGAPFAACPTVEHYLDSYSCQSLSGWAADRTQPNVAVGVRVVVDGTLRESITADRDRPDVAAYLGDNGKHGYSWSLPQPLRDNRFHTYEFTADGAPTRRVSFVCGP